MPRNTRKTIATSSSAWPVSVLSSPGSTRACRMRSSNAPCKVSAGAETRRSRYGVAPRHAIPELSCIKSTSAAFSKRERDNEYGRQNVFTNNGALFLHREVGNGTPEDALPSMAVGWLVPGMNAVIMGAVLAAGKMGWEVIGIRDGFQGLLHPDLLPGWWTDTLKPPTG